MIVNPLVTASKAAKLFNVERRTIHNWINEGTISSIRAASTILVVREEVEKRKAAAHPAKLRKRTRYALPCGPGV